MTEEELSALGFTEEQIKRLKRNGRYWKHRFGQVEQSQHDRGVKALNDINDQYQKALKDIEAKIDSWYRRIAENNEVTLQEARKMLDAKELAEFRWDVNEYIKRGQENAFTGEWMRELENASAKAHIERLEALQLQLKYGVREMFNKQSKTITDAMREIYEDGYYQTAYEVQHGFGVGWSFDKLDEKQIDKVINRPWAADGRNFSERVWDNREKLVNELDQTLTQNIILGKDPQEAIDAISHEMNVSKAQAGRLVMTEEAYFSSIAQKDSFEELDVESYEIVATLDNKTSDICQAMDGKVFRMSDWEVGVTAPPFHPWCRSTTVPAFDDDFGLDEIGERAAKDKDGKTYYVPADMTYQQWEKAFVQGDKTGVKPVQDAKQVSGNINPPAAYDGDFSDFEPLELTEESRAALNNIRQLGNDTGWEHGVIQNPDGTLSEPFTSKLPNKVSVDASAIQDGSTLMHCHTNATPLSSEDLKLLINPNIDAIMNIASNGDVYLVNVNGYHPDIHEFETAEAEIRAEVDAMMVDRYLDEGWTTDELIYMCVKEELFRLCRHFEWMMYGGRLA